MDFYAKKHRKIIILTPNLCGRKIFVIRDKYDHYSNKQLNRNPYIKMILNLQREECTLKVRDSYRGGFTFKRETIYTGNGSFVNGNDTLV
jgi:hypothetical protein